MQESYNPQSFSRFFFFLCFLFTATMSLLAQDVNKPALPTATSASDKRERDSLKFYGRFGPRNKTRDSLSKNVGYGTGSPNGKKAASSIHNDATPAVITRNSYGTRGHVSNGLYERTRRGLFRIGKTCT
jgi:hypothetical protein